MRPPRPWPTGCSPLALLFCCSLFAGCAAVDVKPPDTRYQSTLGTVAVIATERSPQLAFEGFAGGKGPGALSAAGGSFASCLSGTGSAGCSGDACGVVLLVMLGICGVAGLVGGAAGAADAPGGGVAEASTATLARAAEARTIQDTFRAEVESAAIERGARIRTVPAELARKVAAGQDYRALADRGIDTALETTVAAAGTEGSGINPPLAAYLQVRVRVVSTRDNSERHLADYSYFGKRLKRAAWAADEGKPLMDELRTGYRVLAAHVYDNVFELYPFPDRAVHSAGGALSTSFGLAPVAPATRGQLTGDPLLGRLFEWTAVDTLSPTLKWQAFPRASDVAAAPEEMARVRQVSYDLVIAREQHGAPAEIVYQRHGLPAPEHAVEIPLPPATRYFWTVRAHFELDGRPRVTEWGSTHFAARERIAAPSEFSYRFRTPAAD